MKVVVFGGSGFLGSHVADVLVEKGYDVSIFDINESQYMRENQKFVKGDILDSKGVMEAIADADYVYDFAGLADLDSAATRPVDTVMLNVVGTCNILDACVAYKVKRFVYASSFYANSERGGFYRCSKQAAEIYIEEYARKYGLEYTILRYGSLYGPRSDASNGIRHMLRDAINTGVVKYNGTGEEVREYIHVRDAAELSVKILHDDYIDKHIVLTGHDAYKVKDIIKVMGEILDKEVVGAYSNQSSELHYITTPYTYKPTANYKLVLDLYHDLGQGLIECIDEMINE